MATPLDGIFPVTMGWPPPTARPPMPPNRPPAFLVGEHPALDFLNTTATPSGTRVEWLADGDDLIDWLGRTGLIEPGEAEKVAGFGTGALDEVARRAREFRGWLRGFVVGRMGGPIDATAAPVGPLNELLAGDESYRRVEADGGGAGGSPRLLVRRVRRWGDAGELLHPVADAAADLICRQDFRLVRACEGTACSLLFLDRTRARTRRWCSMAACGNRAKAAAFRTRREAK